MVGMETGSRVIGISTGIWDWERGRGCTRSWRGGRCDSIQDQLHKGMGRAALGTTPGVGARAQGEHPGKEKGVNSARDLGMLQDGGERAGKRLQLHCIMEGEDE